MFFVMKVEDQGVMVQKLIVVGQWLAAMKAIKQSSIIIVERETAYPGVPPIGSEIAWIL